MSERVTLENVRRQARRYVELCEELGAIPAGFHVGLDEGSVTYGRAFRLFVSGDAVLTPEGGIGYPNGSGHGRPPFGSDFLGMTRAAAYEALLNRCDVLSDVLYLKGRGELS
jgi:hypothetical protein